MNRRLALLLACAFLIGLTQFAHAQQKITGPWLWVIAPADAGKGGAASTDIDQLDKASGGKVKEDDVAKNGAKKGDKVGNLDWVEAELPETGGNNIQDMINKDKAKWGGDWAKLPADINDTSSYALITVEAATAQNGVTMKVGSDDSIKVWFNGKVAHKNAVDRGASGFQDTFKIDLNAGKNLLLVKVGEKGGGWSMFAGINANFTAVGKKYEPLPEPGPKITGPYLWIIAPADAGKGGAASNDIDLLAKATGGNVTEEKVAKFGVNEGDKAGSLTWVKATIPATGGNNVQDMINAGKASWGGEWAKLPADTNDYSSYAYIVLNSAALQATRMFTGSDDAIKVWLNGEVVSSKPVDRGASDFQEDFPVVLKPGANRVLVKVSERGGGWSMFFGAAAGVTFQTAVPVEPAGRILTTWGNVKAKY